MEKNELQEQVIRYRELKRIVPLSRSTVWRKSRAGEFPMPIPLGSSAIGWLLSEVQAWIEAQAAARHRGRR